MRRSISTLAGLTLIGLLGTVSTAPAADPDAARLPPRHATLPDLQGAYLPRSKSERARIASVTAPTRDFTAPERFEENPAGAATVRVRPTADAFSDPSGNIGLEGRMRFNLGNGLFTRAWVSAPSSTIASDGLGPLYNARGCQQCHLKDGRGHPPVDESDPPVALFLRLSIPHDGTDDPASTAAAAEIEDWLATRPDPVYGGQLQNFALAGHTAEGQMTIDYTDVPVALSGGESVTLRAPSYAIINPGYGPMRDDLMISPRIAPQMIGLGLLESIPAAEILARADPDDRDGDGISGRASIVMSDEFHTPMLGRFGHKAGKATVKEQSAAAFAGDMGLSTPIFPDSTGECSPAQEACRAAPDGGDRDTGLEVSGDALDLVSFYASNLGVPARRAPGDPEVLRGKQVFYETGCTACHTPKYVTARATPEAEDQAQSFQLIWPYTDLLLHDMGEGLADNRPEGRATGREWRTPPLWGIGLTAQVTGRESYLHDGRARSLLEAVLWHGGEAQAARDRVVEMEPDDRAALLRFLEDI